MVNPEPCMKPFEERDRDLERDTVSVIKMTLSGSNSSGLPHFSTSGAAERKLNWWRCW